MTDANSPASGEPLAAAQALERGIELRNRGDLDGAIALYREAAALDRFSPAPWFNVGNALLDQGRWEDAHAAFSQAVDRKSTRLNSSHMSESRMPSSA